MRISLKERYQVWWDVNGALAAVERRVEDGGNDLLRRLLITAPTTFKSSATSKILYNVFNYFRLFGFTFKFRLCITH